MVRLWEVQDAQPAGDEGRGARGYDGPGDDGSGLREGGTERAGARDFGGVGAEEGGH